MMYLKFKEFLPVLFWVSAVGASASGWKPIPPPRGLYPKVPQTHHEPFKHPFIDEYRLEALKSSLTEQQSDGLQEEEYHKQQVPHSHKYNFDDIFGKPLEDSFFKKVPETIKIYKQIAPSYEEAAKRPPISFHNYNNFRGVSPTKTVFFEKPEEEVKYLKPYKTGLYDDYKFYKAPNFGENDIKAYLPIKTGHPHDDHCSLYKVVFRQDLYFQYIQYKVNMPDLKEFTLCMWNKFHNHSNDHPLFSYAVRHQPKAIYMWVQNTERSNYYNMKVNGHTIFRLNYPIRLNRWYHTCQSWNGKTGEWQVWVNSERIGRGFHNLLVGHVIPGNGLAISGQEQRQFGGGFLEGPGAPKGSGGFLGEITMVQMYRIALTAGKAYTDHRHHHSLYASTTPEPPPLPQEETPAPPEHPFLENGQLKQPLKVFELAEALRTKGNMEAQENPPSLPEMDFLNAHFASNYYGSLDSGPMSPFAVHGNAINLIPIPDHALYKRNDGNEKKKSQRDEEPIQSERNDNEQVKRSEKVKFVSNPSSRVHVEKIKYEDKTRENEEREQDYWKERNKRETNGTSQFEFVTVDEDKTEPESDTRLGRSLEYRGPGRGTKRRTIIKPAGSTAIPVYKETVRQIKRKESDDSEENESEKETAKRQILLGDPSLGFGSLSFIGGDYGPIYGHMPVLGYPLPQMPPLEPEYPQIDDNPLNHPDVEESEQPEEENPAPSQPEPAEGEVRRIMNVCSGCEFDPFRKVAVISWRSIPKKIYSGALFVKATPQCRKF